MISLIVGVFLGYRVQPRKLGLVLSIVYGLLIGQWAANIAHRDSAVFSVPILAVIGLLVGWFIKWYRSRKTKIKS